MNTNFQVFKEVLGTLSLGCSMREGRGRGLVPRHCYAEHYLPLSCGPSYHSREFPSMDTLVDSLPHQMHLMHSDVIQPYPRMGKDTLERCCGTLMQVAMNCSYCIAILLTKDIPTFPLALGLDSTYDYKYLGTLLPVDLSQMHPQDVLCSSSGRAGHN